MATMNHFLKTGDPLVQKRYGLRPSGRNNRQYAVAPRRSSVREATRNYRRNRPMRTAAQPPINPWIVLGVLAVIGLILTLYHYAQ